LKCGLYHVAPLERWNFYYCLDLFFGKDLVDRAVSDQSCSPDWRNAGPAWEAVRSKNECLERKCVLWPSGRYRMWESGQNTVTQERTTESIFYRGYRKKEHCGGTRSLSFVHTTGALHCTERIHMKWVLGVYIAGKRAGDAFCRRPRKVRTSLKTARRRRSNGLRRNAAEAGRSKTVTCRGENLGLGAPDAFRKRRASVTEPYLRTTKRNLKRLQKMC